eukprot:CAMPEP_0170556002 /NCGR_PEP_ID=MMETSP0211-20121228/15099_1 /TAXON_ID=311385 /ORGANISM="Pseudokeronopsis sp., Strain OXSARD2" /LENGTH=62 /DNA_ID=CAMNT_0010866083 /DNA_START=445 /DNA_END=633 /DNA_ORIENTATION=-
MSWVVLGALESVLPMKNVAIGGSLETNSIVGSHDLLGTSHESAYSYHTEEHSHGNDHLLAGV